MPCKYQELQALQWTESDGQDLLDLCRKVGVENLFCQGDVPPTFDDPGLAERLAARPLPKGGLYVYGPTGTHKTHLLSARTIHAAQRGYSACMLNWPMFCAEVRSTYQAAATETERGTIERYAGLAYLAVDDLGAGRRTDQTDHAVRIAHLIFDRRYERCRVTDISSNLKPTELAEQFDEPIARRVAEMTTPYVMLLDGG